MRELSIKTPVISTYEAEDNSVLEIAGEFPSGQLYYFAPEGDTKIQRISAFNNAFQKTYGYKPTVPCCQCI